MATRYTEKVFKGAVATKDSEEYDDSDHSDNSSEYESHEQSEDYGKIYWEKIHTELTKKNKKKIERLDFEKKSAKWIITYRSQMFEDDHEQISEVLAIVDSKSEHNINDIFANFVLQYIVGGNKLSHELQLTISMALGRYKDIIAGDEVEFDILLENIVSNEKEHEKFLDIIHHMIKTDKKKTELKISIDDLNLGFMTATISCKKYSDIECVPKKATLKK